MEQEMMAFSYSAISSNHLSRSRETRSYISLLLHL